MDEKDLIKKAQAGKQISEDDIKKLEDQKKKEAYKKMAISSIMGAILGFLPNLIQKFFNKK